MFRRRQYCLQYNDSYSNTCKCDHLSLSYPCLEFLWKPAVFGQPAQSSKCVVSMLGSCCQCNTRCPTDTYCKPGKQVYFPQFVSSETSLFGDVWCRTHSWFTFPKRDQSCCLHRLYAVWDINRYNHLPDLPHIWPKSVDHMFIYLVVHPS